MTGVPRHTAEHRLNVREGCSPIRQKKRGQAPERNKSNPEEDHGQETRTEVGEVCRFKDLNKAFPQMWLPTAGDRLEVESLCDTPSRCFLGCVQRGTINKMAKDGLRKKRADAVLSLPSPRCLKDVQKLNGKLASLNRLLSKFSLKKATAFPSKP
ncbi:hypothetical protein Tco_0158850 [Tanacetum coccineum]